MEEGPWKCRMQNQGGGDGKATHQAPPLHLQVAPPPGCPASKFSVLEFKRLTELLVQLKQFCFLLESYLIFFFKFNELYTKVWVLSIGPPPKGLRLG